MFINLITYTYQLISVIFSYVYMRKNKNFSFDFNVNENKVKEFSDKYIREFTEFKSKLGINIYTAEFDFNEFLVQDWFILAYPGMAYASQCGGALTTALLGDDGNISGYLVAIDIESKKNWSEKEYEFFLGHELGHAYYDHLQGLSGLIDNPNMEIEADNFSLRYNKSKNIDIQNKIGVLKVSRLAAAAATSFYVKKLESNNIKSVRLNVLLKLINKLHYLLVKKSFSNRIQILNLGNY